MTDNLIMKESEKGAALVELVLAIIAGLMMLSYIFGNGLHQLDAVKVNSYAQEVSLVADRVKSLKRTSSTNATGNNYLLLGNMFFMQNADLPNGMINATTGQIENNLSGYITVRSGSPLLNTFYIDETIPKKYCIDAVTKSWKSSHASALMVNGTTIALDSIAQPQINMTRLITSCAAVMNTITYKILW